MTPPQEQVVGDEIQRWITITEDKAQRFIDLACGAEQTVGTIYPGAILWAPALRSGTLQQANEVASAPYEVSVDLFDPPGTYRAEHGTHAEYAVQMSALLSRGGRPVNRVTFTSSKATSCAMAAMELGLSAKYLGAKVQAKLSEISKDSQSLLLICVDQPLFDLVAAPPKQDALVSPDSLREGLGFARLCERLATEELAYVSKVTYGRRLLLRVSSRLSQEELERSLKLNYDGVVVSVSGMAKDEATKLHAATDITAVAIGGQYNEELINLMTAEPGSLMDRLTEYLKSSLAIASAREPEAFPITFSTKYLRDNLPVSIVDTATMTRRSLVGSIRFQYHESAKIGGGGGGSSFSSERVPLGCHASRVRIRSGVRVDSIELFYKDRNGQEYPAGGRVSRNGDKEQDFVIPPGHILVGLRDVYSGDCLDSVTFVTKDVAGVLHQSARYGHDPGGGPSGSIERADGEIVQVSGRHGNVVDSIGVTWRVAY